MRSHTLFNVLKHCLTLVVLTGSVIRSNAQPTLIFTPVISTGLSTPIDFANAADGSNRIFVVQQSGNINVYDAQYNFLGIFLTVSGISLGSERGLLSMAFSPDYNSNGFFYVYYTNVSGNLELARYHISSDPNVADASSKSIVLTITHTANANHNGGKLNFGPDGYLYFATGDGGGGGDQPNNAQNGNILLGKMLRIAVNNSATAPFYTIPADNPYINDANVLDEVYALGLRNPFRWSFDKLTHDMWIGDVGQDAWEEVDFRAAGTTAHVNYGWRCYEGTSPFNTAGCGPSASYVAPVFVYPNPTPGASAVTGGIVYRGSDYPALQGYYFAADVYSSTVYLIRQTSGSFTTTQQPGGPPNVVCFGETEDSEVYAVSLAGSIYRISTDLVIPPPPPPPQQENNIYPNPVTDRTINVYLDGTYNSLYVVSMNGAVVLKKDIRNLTGHQTVFVPTVQSGIYFVRLSNADDRIFFKIFIKQ